MIRKFKLKTLLILTMILWGILIGILLTLNYTNYKSNYKETKKLLMTQENIIEDNDVDVLPPIKNGQEFTKIYSISIDENGEFKVIFTHDNSNYSEDTLIRYAKEMLSENKMDGIWGHFRYKIGVVNSKQIISFLDYSLWEHQQSRMLFYSLIIGVAGMILLFIVTIFLTEWLVRPVIDAFDKQKQFISDAGHELKTPLTVVKASLEILEEECGNNKYIQYIREENNRMTALIYELLSLSSLEKRKGRAQWKKVDFSRLVEGTALPFESLAYENNLQLIMEIEEGIHIPADELQIRQLLEVLLDNAIKHTYPKGYVIVRMERELGKVILQVKNQGDPIPDLERSKIFDRFYRVDKSRNRKEGRYGLGLAIASSIVEMHKGKISVGCKGNWTDFRVILPEL